jgi:uncharacterized integral membrane protein
MMPSANSVVAIAITAVWTVAIALITLQNAEPVSLRFLSFLSVPLPFGLVLALSATVGMLGTVAITWLWQSRISRHRRSGFYAEFYEEPDSR